MPKSHFFKSPRTSLFTGGTFSYNLKILHEYLKQHSLKLEGANYDFKWVEVPGSAPYWKTCTVGSSNFYEDLFVESLRHEVWGMKLIPFSIWVSKMYTFLYILSETSLYWKFNKQTTYVKYIPNIIQTCGPSFF